MKLRDQIADEIERFLERTGMPPATFGRKAMKDPTFVYCVRDGRDLKAGTIDRVREFMAEYRLPAQRRSGNDRVAA